MIKSFFSTNFNTKKLKEQFRNAENTSYKRQQKLKWSGVNCLPPHSLWYRSEYKTAVINDATGEIFLIILSRQIISYTNIHANGVRLLAFLRLRHLRVDVNTVNTYFFHTFLHSICLITEQFNCYLIFTVCL